MESQRFYNSFIYHVDPAEFYGINTESRIFQIYTPPSGERLIVNSFNDGSSVLNQTIGVQLSQRYALRNLRMMIDVVSLAAVPVVVPDPLDSDLSLAIKNSERDSQYPAFLFELRITKGGVTVVPARLRLHNRRPGYLVNLLPYLTNKDEFVSDVAISIRIQDIGHGFPQLDDLIQVWGEVEEIAYFCDLQSKQSGTLTLAGAVNATLSGTLNNSGGNGGGEQVNPSMSISLTGLQMPEFLFLYFLPSLPNQPIELSTVSTRVGVVPNAGEPIDLNFYLNQNGNGYYILAPGNQTADNFFQVAVSTNSFQPTGRATLMTADCQDSSLGHLQSTTLPVIWVENAQVQISATLQV